MQLRQADFVDRNNFADFLNRRGLLGTAAEIGVFEADFSCRFLDKWHGKWMYCVDAWQAGYDPTDPSSAADMHHVENKARSRLRAYRERVCIVKDTSLTAVKRVGDWFDFVYIDANHRIEAVAADLRAWWPLVSRGGILAGHDFLCPGETDGGHGRTVQSAVLQFAAQRDLDIWLVLEPENKPWSYYMEKP